MLKVNPYDPFSFTNEVSGIKIRTADPTVVRIQALLLPRLHSTCDWDALIARHIGASGKDYAYMLEGKIKSLRLVIVNDELKDFVLSIA